MAGSAPPAMSARDWLPLARIRHYALCKMTRTVRETLERELKLNADTGFCLPDLPGETLAQRTFTSTYYDTAELELAAAGITLRHRIDADKLLWQLKLPRGRARLELEVAGQAGAVPGELADLLAARTRGRELVAGPTLQTTRRGVRFQGAGTPLADVTVDEVATLDGDDVTGRFTEIEVELTGGDESILEALAAQLKSAGARESDERPKLFQVLDLDIPQPPQTAPRGASLRQRLGSLIAEQAGEITAHDPGTRLGSDPEELHQMRVATRRLRALLRAVRPVADRSWSEALRAELAWLGRALGPVRDLDVLLEHLRAQAAGLEPGPAEAFEPLLAKLEHERAGARDAMLRALRKPRYLELLDALDAAAERPRLAPDTSGTLSSIARHEFRRFRKAARRLPPEATDDELHALRILAKRARYAAEFAAHDMQQPPTRFIRSAKRVQDILGVHQDARVCEERLLQLRADAQTPDGSVAVDSLLEHERARQRGARVRYPDSVEDLLGRGKETWR